MVREIVRLFKRISQTSRSGVIRRFLSNTKILQEKTNDPRPPYTVNMRSYIGVDTPKLEADADELTDGKGYLVYGELFSAGDIAHARDMIHFYVQNDAPKATHFHGSENSRPDLQARVWNLLDKGKIFEKMVQHPKILNIVHAILGDDAQLGSIATNTLFPGATGQEPHIDYPYWDYYDKKHWPVTPKVKEVAFHMNLQATILLDDFTEENGATAVIPGSQRIAKWPDQNKFYELCTQITGKAGDVILFPGLINHAAMPNNSQSSRTGVLIQYLPKYIRPMEDLKRSVALEIQERASPALRKLLTLDYPYPSILDKAEAKNTEGSNSEFEWK